MSSQLEVEQPLRIAIIGGGVGGLCLASVLAKFAESGNLEVALYEATANFVDVGAGLILYGRSFDIVDALELQDEFSAIQTISEYKFTPRRSDRGPEGQPFAAVSLPGRAGTFHRADLRSLFARNCERSPKLQIHFNKRLVSLTQASVESDSDAGASGSYEAHFSDGTTAACDVVIGADGVRSAVRTQMFDFAAAQRKDDTLRDFGPPIWSGESAHRALISMERANEEWSKLGREGVHPLITAGISQYTGVRKKVIAYAIKNHTLANIVAYIREANEEGPARPGKWVRDVEPEYNFEGWESGALALINGITAVSRWEIHVTRKLPFFAHGGIALLGDAAHAMVPHNASGANQAIEDAYILGRLLTHPSTTRATVHLALEAYDSARRPRAQEMAEISSNQGRLTDFTAAEGEDLEAVAAKLRWHSERTGEGSVGEELGAAEVLFERLIAESK